MKKRTWHRNFRRRLLAPARGNGRLQQMAWHLLRALGRVSTSELIGDAYADRLLLGGERRHNWFNIACTGAFKAVGAIRVERAKTIGRPWIWTLPQSGANSMPETPSGKDH